MTKYGGKRSSSPKARKKIKGEDKKRRSQSPKKSKSKNNEGLVVAVGPGARNETGDTVPMCVAVGDKVLLPEFGGAKIEMEGEEFQMFRESHHVAKLN